MNHLRGFGHIEIGGNKYPLKFGTSQSWEYREMNGGIDLTTYFDTFSGENINKLDLQGVKLRDLLYTALKDGARVTGQPFTLQLADVMDLMDHFIATPTLVNDIFLIMLSAYEQLSPNGQGVAKTPEETAIA